MALVQIQNPTKAESRSVITSVAMKNGMVVKLVQGTAVGEIPQVALCSDADLADVSVLKGVITYIADDNLKVDTLVPNTGSDNTMDIPPGVEATFWYNSPMVYLHQVALDTTVVMGTIREGAKLAVNAVTGKIAPLVATGVDANRDQYVGVVYHHDGVALSVILNAL
jgi:hypothetical protein